MGSPHPELLRVLLIVWGVITAGLVLLLIRRGILSSKEEDQLFLDQAEQHMAREQLEVVGRLNRLTGPITILSVASGVLLLAIAGIALINGFHNF